jgi:hypothetical protein
MSIETAMRGYLIDTGLSVGERIYPMGKRPQATQLPALSFALVSGPTSHYSHAGATDHEVSYQFDCWADDADDAMDLAQELAEALDGFRGSWDDYRIGSVFLSVVLDDHEPDTGLYRRLRQAEVHYADPIGS